MRPAEIYEEEEVASNGAELSLGMGSLIGIFFGLALVCGVFFGFGYMMGHRTPGKYVTAEPLLESPKPASAVAPKPSPQVPEQPAEASRVVVPAATPDNEPTPKAVGTEGPRAENASAVLPAPAPASAPKPQAAAKAAVAPPPIDPAPVKVQPATQPAGSIMVQIAAVKNRPDAEALADALRKNGFNPTIRTEAEDKLLHVQIGPFDNRDDAKAMRQKLSNAGYNAFIK